MAAYRGGPKRRFSAYGSLDKKTRRWVYLPTVHKSVGQTPDGEQLVYVMNRDILEVGQGVGGLRGLFSLPALCFGVAGTVLLPGLLLRGIAATGGLQSTWDEIGTLGLLGVGIGFLLLLVVGVFFLVLFVNDLFGYVDAPLRFDRANRKVYVWNGREKGPLVLDWDRIKPVAQSVGAPPYQVNQFRSVLLVDEDESGDVRFEDGMPRIAQIGAALLNREQTLAAYEYVRTFMEQGRDALPPIKQHLVQRPRGWRPFLDIFGICHGMMRRYPSLPQHQRRPGWLIFGVVLVAIFAAVLWPLQLAQGIAVKVTARLPKWPQDQEAQAAKGGPLVPPFGAEPNDAPMLPHERLITGLWLASALIVYAFIAWAG